MKNFFKRIYNFILQLFKKNQSPDLNQLKQNVKKSEMVKIAPENVYKYKKAIRNQNKRYATTKSFNGKNKPFKKVENNPLAKLYLKLLERKKYLDSKFIKNRILRNKYGKVQNYKKWHTNRLTEYLKAI